MVKLQSTKSRCLSFQVTIVNGAALEIYNGADANVIASYFESHIHHANFVRITTIGANKINSLSENSCEAGDQVWLLNGKEVTKYAGFKGQWKAAVQNGKDVTLSLKVPCCVTGPFRFSIT